MKDNNKQWVAELRAGDKITNVSKPGRVYTLVALCLNADEVVWRITLVDAQGYFREEEIPLRFLFSGDGWCRLPKEVE